MKINKRYILSFVAPFMVFISAIGLIFRDNSKKIFYLPIGLMGIVIILERGMSRQLDRKNILKQNDREMEQMDKQIKKEIDDGIIQSPMAQVSEEKK